MEVLGNGVYSIPEAARLTGLRARRVRDWFRGRQSEKRKVKSVFQSDYEIVEKAYAISFLDLIELNVAGKLREAGVPLQHLRKVYKQLREDFGDHPFSTREIYVRDKKVFTRGLSDDEATSLSEAITRQSYFDKIILPFLKKIDYDEATKFAARWRIAKMVVLDPKIRFGRPTVLGTGIATRVLHDSYYANDEDAERVADWFGVESKHVMAAVEFENSLAA